MKPFRAPARCPALVLAATLLPLLGSAATPQELFATAITRMAAIVEPPTNAPAQSWTTTLRIADTTGLGSSLQGQTATLAFQAPDRFRIATTIQKRPLTLGRAGQELWLVSPATSFGILGKAGVPRFAASPNRLDDTQLKPIRLPLTRDKLLLLPLLMQVEARPDEIVQGAPCHVLHVTPQPQAIEALRIPQGSLTLWLRASDSLPLRLRIADSKSHSLVLELEDPKPQPAWSDQQWEPASLGPISLQTVALSHVTRFLDSALSMLTLRMPTLEPATGKRQLLATAGAGRLEDHDGTRVLFLKGSPEDMGQQHGTLLRHQVRDLVAKILYGIGVGSSFEKGRWFFGEIEDAQRRLKPFIPERYLREMDAIALAANLEPEEVRLANFFPELFHCSGFAVFGEATADQRLYHGRILDYLKGVGLEPNATVIVHQPDTGFAWANISYAGFVGTVTAMNERRIAIGEMGGRGEGNWDGKPMAQLLREVMEQADTLEKAIAILQRGPRTCEYYYVVSDGNTRQAVGVAATPSTFELVWPGTAHERLPRPVPDTVLLSAGDRYQKLVDRVLAAYGRLDDVEARRLMERPVAMNSNIHSVLFAPETLDFWVANADSQNVASHTRYTHYNLADLLRLPPASP